MATSWTSLGGSGDRLGMIKTSAHSWVSSRQPMLLINGDRLAGYTDNYAFSRNSVSEAPGIWIEFAFNGGIPRVIDGVAIIKGATAEGSAVWSLQGFDGVAWQPLCQLRLDTTEGRVEATCSNTTAYLKYRLVVLSGMTTGAVYIYDVEFRIDDRFDEFGVGDRTNQIAVTGNVPLLNGRLQDLVAWNINAPDTALVGLGSTTAGQFIEFAFPRAVILKNVFVISRAVNCAYKKWVWQRLDGQEWADISPELSWGAFYGGYTDANGVNRFELTNEVAATRYRMVRVGTEYPDTGGRIRSFCFQVLPASGPGTDTGDATAELMGAAIVGGELTCAFADNDPDGPASAVAYQWLRGGAEIAGATAATYTPRAADIGATLACRVSYTDAGGTQETITTAASAPVAPAARRLPPVALDAGAGLAGLLHRGRLVLAAMAAGAELAARVRRMSPHSVRLDAGVALACRVRVDRPLAAAFAAGADLRCRVVAARGRPVAAAFEAAVDHRAVLHRLRPREVPVVQSTVIVFAL